MKARLSSVIALLLGASLLFVVVGEVKAQTYNAPSGLTRISFGPNSVPPMNQADEFRSTPFTDANGVAKERIWVFAQVCCTSCNCPQGSTCGVQFNGSMAVTGSAGTGNVGIPLQTECASNCISMRLVGDGNIWGIPATSVSVTISAWCICCIDGNPVSSNGNDNYSPVVLDPTATNPDPWP